MPIVVLRLFRSFAKSPRLVLSGLFDSLSHSTRHNRCYRCERKQNRRAEQLVLLMFCVRSDVRSDEEKSAILSRGKGSPCLGEQFSVLHFGSRTYLLPTFCGIYTLHIYIYREYRVYPFGGGHDCPSAHHKANLQQQRFQNLVFDFVSEPITGERWFFGERLINDWQLL